MKRKVLFLIFAIAGAFGVLSAQSVFRHPGLLHSEADFEAVKARIAAGDATATEALAALRVAPPINGDHGHAWAVNEYITRGISGDENYMNAYRNVARAYQAALVWKITGEEWYADVALDVLNAYRMWNKGMGGNSNISLIPGFIGYQLLNAAEIMRDCPKWSAEDFALFKQYMIDVWFTVAQDFLERRHDTVWREHNWYHYHSNWGVGNALFCVSLGVFCDLPDIYNYGMYWLKEGPGNESLNVTALHPDAFGLGLCGYGWGLIPWFHADERAPLGYFNQMQESGRDQGHAMAALGLLSYAFESAYNQGDNAFCNLNNCLIPGKAGSAMVAGAAEYVAAYNVGNDDLPYQTNWWMTGLSGTGRGQWRPIWQLFINHYQNRMGIPMKYCSEMKALVGMEHGGGAYGHNSGGYDHTGWGDLMYNDAAVDPAQVPTILFPSIASATETRQYAEIRDVEPGTVLTLSASLPEGEPDTGNWTWEDGVTGAQRLITADHSGLYRLIYTNANGVESTQLFSVAVKGEGIRASLSASYTYNGVTVGFPAAENESEIPVGKGCTVTIGTGYANWNYITSEEWFDENGKLLGTGGVYAYTLPDLEPHTLKFRLTNQSGVVLEKVFHIVPDEHDLTGLLPDPACETLDVWELTPADGFGIGVVSVSGFTGNFVERWRPAEDGGQPYWGLPRFRISQTLGGLTPGKYEFSAAFLATQQGMAGEAGKNHVRDVWFFANGALAEVSSRDASSERVILSCYVGEDGEITFGALNTTNQNKPYSDNGANWWAIDNLALNYVGTDDMEADWEALRAEALTVAETDVTPALYRELTELSGLTVSDLPTVARLQRALGEARLLKPHYAYYKALYERYKAYVETEGGADAVLTEALAAVPEAGTADEFYAAFDALYTAWQAYIPQTRAAVDVSDLLPDDGFLKYSGDGVWYDTGLRWKTDASDGNYRTFAIDGSAAARGDATGLWMTERFCGGNFFERQQLIYTVMSGMPVGRYVFTAAAQKGSEAGVIELFAGENATQVMSVMTLRSYAVSSLFTGTPLTVGIRSGWRNGCNWTSMADMSLTYHSPLMLLEEALDEAATLTYGTDNNGTLQQAVEQAQGLLSSGESAERMTAYQALLAAMEQYRMDNASAEHPVDLTARMQNASLDWGSTVGWNLTVTDTNYPAFNQGVAEFYNTTFNLWQTLEALPEGIYRVSAQTRSNAGAANTAFRLYAVSGDYPEVSVCSEDMTRADGTDFTQHLGQNASDLNADASVGRIRTDYVLVRDGTLTVGVKCDTNTVWCVMNDFRLEYLGGVAESLVAEWDETQTDLVVEDAYYEKLTVKRGMKSGGTWNTFCVPFDMTAEQLTENHITEVRKLRNEAEVRENSITLTFEESTEIRAGVSYIVKTDASYPGEIVMEHVMVKEGGPLSLECSPGISMTGNYVAMKVPQGAFFISNNAFYVADRADAVNLKGFRAYLTYAGGANEVNRMLVNIDDEVTAIEALHDGERTVDVFTVSGVRVRKGVKRNNALQGLPFGVYIIEGKKTVCR